MVIVGVVGYVKNPCGLRCLNMVWAQHLSEEVKRRFYKNWCKSKKKAFYKYSKKLESDEGKKNIQAQLEKLKTYSSVVRVLAHTQVCVLSSLHPKQIYGVFCLNRVLVTCIFTDCFFLKKMSCSLGLQCWCLYVEPMPIA